MRNKFYLSDLTILFVSLSSQWGTTERRCLKDVVNHRNAGGSVILYCLKNSFLDQEASKQDIPRIYSSEPKGSWTDHLSRYFFLKNFLKKTPIDLVHVYHHDELSSLCLVLNYYSHAPLVYTYNRIVKKKNSLFESIVYPRIDSIITFFEDGPEHARSIYNLGLRKTHYFGLGLENLKSSKEQLSTLKVTTFFERNLSLSDELSFLLDQISLVLQKFSPSERENFTLYLQTDIDWRSHPLFDLAKRKILERHLENYVTFETISISEISSMPQLRLSFSSQEFISDIDILSSLGQSTLLVPRVFSHAELLQKSRALSYFPLDPREFCQKFQTLLRDQSNPLKSQARAGSTWIDFHDQDHYEFQLTTLYEKLTLQRQRFTRILNKKK